ncbi:uncharacterized protein LOC141622207 [Silene latifolia]|uniref:uncharacterized protein LOC141622207 n=1 Tax=Silene latifolia TaxID=37657 RepID=UPI003D77F761
MQHISYAKKRKMEASENNSTALAHVRSTSQHVDSGIPTTSGTTAIVDADMRQDPRLQGGFAGYIFMCNAKTKEDCFIYRVFGLPASRIDVVEQIKPDAKLFLYDFDVKLLYGPYVADSVGKLALEPYAFGGRFPAQVKFSIANDCLPLPEAAFKDAIKENYLSKFKFKQDLSYEQVDKLVSLFRPITLRSPNQASLAYPSHRSAPVPGIPLPSLHSTHNQIPLSRGGEMPSNLYHSRIAYGRYGSTRSPQPYHPDDPSFQRHDTHPREGNIPVPPQIQGSVPSPAIRSSSLPPSHWVAMAARTQIPSDQTSTFNPSLSNAPGASHVNHLQNASNYTKRGYHYQSYSGTHEAAAVPAAINAYEGNLTSSSNFYAQERPQPGTREVRAVNQYPYYDSTNSTGLSYGHGYQPYIGLHQDVNNVAYGNQTYPISQVPIPEASADPNAASIYANYSTMAYGYQNEGYTGYYQAIPQTSGQSTSDLPVQAYAQTQSLPGLAQTVSSGSGVVDNARSYYNQGY